jgi:preprotein translocase subunit SecG
MILSAIPWLAISINLLLVIFALISVLMIFLILMQRPKQEGLGAAFGGGVTDQVFGARTTDVLQRGTVYLGSMFFLLCLTLAILIGIQNKQNSLVVPKSAATKKTEVAPVVEAAPKSLSAELPAEISTPPASPTVAPVVIPEAPVPAPTNLEIPAPSITPPAVEVPAPVAPVAPPEAPKAP